MENEENLEDYEDASLMIIFQCEVCGEEDPYCENCMHVFREDENFYCDGIKHLCTNCYNKIKKEVKNGEDKKDKLEGITNR